MTHDCPVFLQLLCCTASAPSSTPTLAALIFAASAAQPDRRLACLCLRRDGGLGGNFCRRLANPGRNVWQPGWRSGGPPHGMASSCIFTVARSAPTTESRRLSRPWACWRCWSSCGTPLIEWFSGPAAPSLQSLGTATRLGFAICNVLLLENLYFNTPRELRWNINLLCVALGGVFLYDLLLYADGVLFHRLSLGLVEARAPIMILAAPLIALATVRNRRWAVDIHVSRDVVFHSFTLIASGIFLLAIALIGEVFRRGGSEWGQRRRNHP